MLGRGKMLQAVKQKVERDLEGRVSQYHMADYTNESIEKFCHQLAEKGPEAYLKKSMRHASRRNYGLREVKRETNDGSQFDDDIAVGHASIVTEIVNTDAEGSQTYSLQPKVNKEESCSWKSFTHSSDDSNWRLTKNQGHLQKEAPASWLAVQWPEASTMPMEKTVNEFPSASMGRGRRLKMVSEKSALVEELNPQREISMACDPSYSNERIERYLKKVIEKNEMGGKI